jgi:hypothetical protein
MIDLPNMAIAVARGWCTAPVPPSRTRPVVKRLPQKTRSHKRGPYAAKSPVPGVPMSIVVLMDDFLKAQAEPFTMPDFQRFLDRSGLMRTGMCVYLQLQKFVSAKRLVKATQGVRGRPAQYQKISVPEKDTATRQLASCNGASIPARDSTLTVADAMLRRAITGFCFLLSAFCFSQL